MGSFSIFRMLFVVAAAYFVYTCVDVSPYQLVTAVQGVRDLINLPQEDIDRCNAAYAYLMENSGKSNMTDTREETEHVRNLYTTLHRLLAIADIEKMYIPPMLDAKKGLYANQLLIEKHVVGTLKVGGDSKILDIGCGRGRIAHFAASLTGGAVSGFNIDESQVENAKAYAKETGMDHRLDFKVSDHHERFPYDDGAFDGSYSVQAVWPFFKKHELDSAAREIFRVLKPGARYSCTEYLLTPHFDWGNEEHREFHRKFLPTLAASQSNYPADVTEAFERAGFKVVLSAPSAAPAWPLCESKTDLFLVMRQLVIGLTRIGLLDPWAEVLLDNLMSGGEAWSAAEKAKLADLNWQIIVEKPHK